MRNERTIAIGDVHGCSRALATLIEAIQPEQEDTIVFLGDFLDWGPDSRGVLDQVIGLVNRCTVVPIRGNHEEMLLAAMEGHNDLRYWLKFGGSETLASFGLSADVRSLPSQYVDFLKGCRDFFETSTHLFVHAYYEPQVPLDQQSWNTLRWRPLPPSPVPHCSGKIAIVGHTPQKTGEILDLGFLKCIDTFCHAGGWLTALDSGSGNVWQATEFGHRRR